MAETVAEANYRPTVVIVEDDKRIANRRREWFLDAGFEPLIAYDRQQAFEQVRSAPGVDMIYTDVCLEPGGEDRSGEFIGEMLRAERRRSIFLVAVSGVVDPQNVRARDQQGLSVFDQIYRKMDINSRDSFKSEAVKWHTEISGRVRARRELAETLISDLSVEHRIDAAALAILRKKEVAETIHSVSEISSEAADADVSAFKASNFMLRFVDNSYLERRVDQMGYEGEVFIQNSVPVWVKNIDGRTWAELYKYPEIGSFADSEEEAILQLFSLMHAINKGADTEALESLTGEESDQLPVISDEAISYIKKVMK